MSQLIILNTAIRQDEQGRYSLNDLHKAAIVDGVNERTKEQAKFLVSPQIQDLIKEISNTQNMGLEPINVIHGGKNRGTYVCKELVYSYAMWISPSFHLKVIRN